MIIEIEQPFYSAGRKYGWPGDPQGIGIAAHLLNGEGDLEVKIGKKIEIYKIDKKKARELVTKYKSVYIAKTMRLGVIPLSEFRVDKPQEFVSLEDMV